MKRDHLIRQARSIVLYLKKEERKSINPHASFADQMIALINNGRVSSKADVIRYTRMSYSRPRMNRQWRIFGEVLEKNLRLEKRDSLLLLFGYLKRLLTIEGKKENGDRKKAQNKEYGRQGKHQRKRRY